MQVFMIFSTSTINENEKMLIILIDTSVCNFCDPVI